MLMFCNKFKELRTTNKYTQSQMAEAFNVSTQTIYNWENNIFIPGIEKLIEIAQFFHVSIDYLIDGYIANLNDREFIEVTGLTFEEVEHIQKTVEYIKRNKENKNLKAKEEDK